ncbi:unnamed protein product [Rodentolepis nana]|uniref:LisH domain-containing protein n=1 Tax=Rodentolepis nana TaxID=102285 RepID=A0A0R3T7W9_RODNA|nr:unnamed protein product [Rodentolepis nana]
MFGKPKTFSSPSDAQANEKLAFYVYEYLVYCGAQKAAQIFLQEVSFVLLKSFFLNLTPCRSSFLSLFYTFVCMPPTFFLTH